MKKQKNAIADALALLLIKRKGSWYDTVVIKSEVDFRGFIGDHIIWLRDPTSFERDSGKMCLLIRKGTEFAGSVSQIHGT